MLHVAGKHIAGEILITCMQNCLKHTKTRACFLHCLLQRSCCTWSLSGLPWQTSFSSYIGGCLRDHQLPYTGFFHQLDLSHQAKPRHGLSSAEPSLSALLRDAPHLQAAPCRGPGALPPSFPPSPVALQQPGAPGRRLCRPAPDAGSPAGGGQRCSRLRSERLSVRRRKCMELMLPTHIANCSLALVACEVCYLKLLMAF